MAGLIGDSSQLIDPKLGPLGYYGGATQTMIPYPGSPALDAASDSTQTTDQRGFLMEGTPDIGAAEFQGSADLNLFWDTDADGDGNPFGVEFALGTNPSVFDADAPNNLAVFRSLEGQFGVRFGYNPDAVGYAVWEVERSIDLESWTVFSSDSDPGAASVLLDTHKTGVFYRFKAARPN